MSSGSMSSGSTSSGSRSSGDRSTQPAVPPSDAPLFHVFVYGSLKPGERYYSQYCEGKVVAHCEAIAYGHLYDLPMGYPAMTLGDRVVHGIRLTFAEASVLRALDELEDYVEGGLTNEYDRQLLEVFDSGGCSLGTAWMYVMPPEQVQQLQGICLPDGRWSGIGRES